MNKLKTAWKKNHISFPIVILANLACLFFDIKPYMRTIHHIVIGLGVLTWALSDHLDTNTTEHQED